MTSLPSPRRLAALSATVILLATAGPVSAAPSVRTTDHRVEIGFDHYGPEISVSMLLGANNEAADDFNVGNCPRISKPSCENTV